MQYALAVWIFWLLGLISFLWCVRIEGLSSLFLLVILSTPALIWALIRKFRKTIDCGAFSFPKAYLFSFLLFLYASLLLSASVYVYFDFLDQGHFSQSLLEYLEQPDVQELLKQPQMQALAQAQGGMSIEDSIRQVGQTPSILWAASILNLNLFIGAILSVPLALISTRRK